MRASPPGFFILRALAAAKPEGTISSAEETSKADSPACGDAAGRGTGAASLHPALSDLVMGALAVPSRSALVCGSGSPLRFLHQISSEVPEKMIVVVWPSLCTVCSFCLPDNLDLFRIGKNLFTDHFHTAGKWK